ncbi:MAG: EamA family transporter RarD [Novosphingobium sp.]
MHRGSASTGGLPYALGAYLIWGLLPLYLIAVRQVPPLEFVGWRIVFAFPICLAAVAIGKQRSELAAAIADRRMLALLSLSALLIAANWVIYTVAIQAGHVFAASLGYYINPLVNVLAGTLFLSERLNRLQWSAVALAAAGVAPLASQALPMLGISLSLAATFCGYGLVRKVTPVSSLTGLTIESGLLMLPALGIVGWFALSPGGSSFGLDTGSSLLLAASGPITAIALLLFAVAARRMDYSALGFVQFLSPTLAFLLGLFVFREELRPVQLVSFATIWTAIALFSWDLWRRRGLIRPA